MSKVQFELYIFDANSLFFTVILLKERRIVRLNLIKFGGMKSVVRLDERYFNYFLVRGVIQTNEKKIKELKLKK